jgi:hypothetical protein
VKKNVQLRSPWIYPQSEELCVILHYYTHANAEGETNTGELLIEYIEYAGSLARTVVEYLEPSEVSFILNTHCYFIYLGRENN